MQCYNWKVGTYISSPCTFLVFLLPYNFSRQFKKRTTREIVISICKLPAKKRLRGHILCANTLKIDAEIAIRLVPSVHHIPPRPGTPSFHHGATVRLRNTNVNRHESPRQRRIAFWEDVNG